eukprot:CAMPEP_0198368256 /NCGR_PEP_ID=MMETSP1450-20131203/155607_1 /TAXON_ID=753684 ORGANISM="Madagascaria erythrocladiodes, Strain CCMP3234" /NCGR_SAMPLE_ID=MMETSP1450 /ASSEMBLY_ACC=CAM_ASM_001115 /LENGTH=434 /DNA_ID=CAMNT_0044075757 /DNA_START=140 /DNA_END=1445 /DNA_ORIENTATION=+
MSTRSPLPHLRHAAPISNMPSVPYPDNSYSSHSLTPLLPSAPGANHSIPPTHTTLNDTRLPNNAHLPFAPPAPPRVYKVLLLGPPAAHPASAAQLIRNLYKHTPAPVVTERPVPTAQPNALIDGVPVRIKAQEIAADELPAQTLATLRTRRPDLLVLCASRDNLATLQKIVEWDLALGDAGLSGRRVWMFTKMGTRKTLSSAPKVTQQEIEDAMHYVGPQRRFIEVTLDRFFKNGVKELVGEIAALRDGIVVRDQRRLWRRSESQVPEETSSAWVSPWAAIAKWLKRVSKACLGTVEDDNPEEFGSGIVRVEEEEGSPEENRDPNAQTRVRETRVSVRLEASPGREELGRPQALGGRTRRDRLSFNLAGRPALPDASGDDAVFHDANQWAPWHSAPPVSNNVDVQGFLFSAARVWDRRRNAFASAMSWVMGRAY